MNPYNHCLALADLLDGSTKPHGLLPLVEARKPSLDRNAQNACLPKAFHRLLSLLMPVEIAELLVPERELFTIQKEAELVRKASNHFRNGLPEAFAIFLDALCDPPMAVPVRPPPTPFGRPTTKSRRKRRARPPRRPLG